MLKVKEDQENEILYENMKCLYHKTEGWYKIRCGLQDYIKLST